MALRFFESVSKWIGLGVETKSATLTDPASFPIFGSIPTISGRSIGPAEAMRCAPVRAAAILISESVGATSFKVFERTDAGKQPAPEHPVFHLVHDEPSDECGAEEFRASLTLDAVLTDNGFAYINRVEGRPVEMIRLDPTRVTIKQTVTGETFYEYQDAASRRIFARSDILRIKAPGGVSPIKHAREAIALALELEAYAARIFTKGGRPSGVLEFPETLGEDAAKRMSDSWHDAHAGDNAGRTAVLEEGGKFNPITYITDPQFLELRRLQVIEIARAFNVPPTMLMDLTNGTFANVEQLDLYFKTYSLRPWLLTWARAMGRALLSTEEERARFFVEPVYDSLAAADTATRSDAIAKQIASRVLTPNEARAMINLPAHPQGNDLANPYTTTTTTGPTVPAKEAA